MTDQYRVMVQHRNQVKERKWYNLKWVTTFKSHYYNDLETATAELKRYISQYAVGPHTDTIECNGIGITMYTDEDTAYGNEVVDWIIQHRQVTNWGERINIEL